MNVELVKQQIARIHSATTTGTLDLKTVKDACDRIERDLALSTPAVVAKPFTPTPLPVGFKPALAPKPDAPKSAVFPQ